MVYKGRIILRPTPMSRKVSGTLKKMFGLYKPEKMKDPFINNKKDISNRPTEGIPAFISDSNGLNKTQLTRRQVVLNRHFTEIISDVIAITFNHRLVEMGITITSIETKAWNKGVDIFYTSDRLYDKNLHGELNSLIGQLKMAIAERDLIGRVPPINFLRDKSDLLEKALNHAMNNMKPTKSEPTTQVIVMRSSAISRSRGSDKAESKFEAKDFEQPQDMANCLFGLNYPELYNRVINKLERGRAISSRLEPVSDLAPIKPFFRELELKNKAEEDPMIRIIKMKRFMVDRRKKAEYQAMLRRGALLRDCDRYKWDIPDEDEDDEDYKQVEDRESTQ